MADNPYGYGASLMNPNAARAGLYDMRMMSTANRMETPFERGMSSRRSPMADRLMGGGGLATSPDYSQFTFDPAAHMAAQQALSPYGLAPLEASQVKQNVLLPNTGFFGDHTRLSGALEGGIFGAMAAHGGNTPGESIQGALEGIVGGRQMRQNLYNRQFATPFEAAHMMSGLDDMRQKRDLQEAEIQHYRAENQRLGRPDHDFRVMGVNKNDQSIYTYDSTTGQGKMQANPDFDPALVKKQATANDISMGTKEQLRIMGVDPLEATPKQISQANQLAQSQAVQRIGAGAGASADARIPAQNYADARKEHDKNVDAIQSKMLKSDDPNHKQAAIEAIVTTRMSEGMQSGNKNVNLIPSDADVNQYIHDNNLKLQQQIDDETSSFTRQWGDQASRKPPSPPEARGKKSQPKIRDYSHL